MSSESPHRSPHHSKNVGSLINRPILDEPPPFLRTWPRVYRFVLIYLAAVIFLFWIFTRYYAPPKI